MNGLLLFADKLIPHNPPLPGLPVHAWPVLIHVRTDHNRKPMEHGCIATVALNIILLHDVITLPVNSLATFNSPKKWLCNGICYPSNRSKQIQETHMAYSTGTQYTRQSLNETQHTWLHRQQVIVCEVKYTVFHSNFAAYIVCRRYKPCGFLGLVWTDCWGNKFNYVITSPANTLEIACKCILISILPV